MKVILLLDIANLGKRGDVKEVADSYAINVLIAKNKAVQATQGELMKWKQKEDASKRKKDIASSAFFQLADALKKTKVTIEGKKRDEKGQLFAQIKQDDIVESIFTLMKISIDPKQIDVPNPIKNLGEHKAYIKGDGKKEMFSIMVK